MSLLSPQLIAFMAIVKHKTVHGAADALFLTQTAVTQRIRVLENHLSVTLFIRSRRGMLLTPEGEALYRYCLASQALEGEALAQIQGTGVESEVSLRLSGPSSIMSTRIMPSCVSVMQQFPNLLIHFDVDDIEQRQDSLRRGIADLVVLQEEDVKPEMRFKKLTPEAYVLVASTKWHGRRLKDIIQHERVIDFDPTDQVTFDYLKQYHLFSHARHSRYFVNRTDNLAFLVAQGIGYTALLKEFAKPYLDNGELMVLNQGKTMQIQFLLAWFDRPNPPAYFDALIHAIN